MTNYEQLLQAKTKKEFEEILFEFQTEIYYTQEFNESFNINKWLSQEKCCEKNNGTRQKIYNKQMYKGKPKEVKH